MPEMQLSSDTPQVLLFAYNLVALKAISSKLPEADFLDCDRVDPIAG
ncbi:MAG: hypothetical protein ABSA90_09875 [Xanthobacteraceae bacterium]|jgi:hypothetical protein